MNQILAEASHRECINALEVLNEDNNNLQALRKLIYNGIQMVNSWKESNYSNVDSRWNIASVILDSVSKITPTEMVSIFPISKRYDGERYGIKDYFYTIQMITEHGWDNQIINPFEFFWNYENRSIFKFMMQLTDLMDVIRSREGKRSMAAEFMDSLGVDSYTLHTTETGKQFMMDKFGRTFPVKKPRPKHLKVVQSK